MKTMIIKIDKNSTNEKVKYNTTFKGGITGVDVVETCANLIIGAMVKSGFSREEILQFFRDKLQRIEQVNIKE